MGSIGIRLSRLYLLALAVVVGNLLPSVSSVLAAQVDLREAARKAVPSTVAIEWKNASSPTTPQPSSPGPYGLPGYTPTPQYPPLPTPSQHAVPPPTATPAPVVTGAPGTSYYPPAVPPLIAPSNTSSVTLASGTVVSPDGLIATPKIDEKTKEEPNVMLADGRTMTAKIVVDDRRSGLVLLKVDATDLPAIDISKDQPELAQALLIAAATGPRERTVSQGIMTAETPAPTRLNTLIHTDAAVGLMSAGGPVADTDGHLVGIVVAKQSREPREVGPALAISAEYVRMMLEAYQEGESVVVERPFLGVVLGNKDEAPVVSEVVGRSPAAKAGVLKGDKITTVDGVDVSTPLDVMYQVGKRRVDDTVVLAVERDGEIQNIDVVVTAVPLPDASDSASKQPATAQPTVINAGGGKILYLIPGDLALHTAKPVPAEWMKEMKELSELAETLPRQLQATQNTPRAAAKEDGTAQAKQHVIVQATPQPVSPVIRVERSNTEQALADLGEQVKSLDRQLKEIRETLNKLNERLGEE